MDGQVWKRYVPFDLCPNAPILYGADELQLILWWFQQTRISHLSYLELHRCCKLRVEWTIDPKRKHFNNSAATRHEDDVLHSRSVQSD